MDDSSPIIHSCLGSQVAVLEDRRGTTHLAGTTEQDGTKEGIGRSGKDKNTVKCKMIIIG